MVYNESNEVIGPTAEYLGTMRRDDMPADWRDDLLVQLEGWIDSIQQIVEFNGYLLIACQVFFVLGVGFGVATLISLSVAQLLVSGVLLSVFVLLTLVVIRWRVTRE